MAADYQGNYSGPLYSELNQEPTNRNSGGSFGFMILLGLTLLQTYRGI